MIVGICLQADLTGHGRKEYAPGSYYSKKHGAKAALSFCHGFARHLHLLPRPLLCEFLRKRHLLCICDVYYQQGKVMNLKEPTQACDLGPTPPPNRQPQPAYIRVHPLSERRGTAGPSLTLPSVAH
ncbi:hypothetical protein J6590_060678 [Homalodisca vitripennis]|nr:hypothetical protein J6590_060678 [Homalodisca vitripennis]